MDNMRVHEETRKRYQILGHILIMFDKAQKGEYDDFCSFGEDVYEFLEETLD